MSYNWKDKTILIAEDSEMNFMLIKKSLELSGATIVWVKNGEEMLESVENGQQVDLILMDISMPKMDGYAASKNLRDAGYSMPIIAQSAFAIEDEKEKILASGCDDFISKPIKKEVLLDKIESLI